MDEAERCHRIAILDRGVLVADGTPVELADALAGRTVQVHAAQPRRAHRALLRLPGVISVAQIGNSLRVLAEPQADIRRAAEEALQAAGVAADVAASDPSLEDVFVDATRGRDGVAP